MENKLTWVELKKVVARQTNLTEKEVNQILTAWLDEMSAAIMRGEELRISGLGTFKLKDMKARKSVNVTTGEEILLPETQRLTFVMANGLEDVLQGEAPKEEAKVAKEEKVANEPVVEEEKKVKAPKKTKKVKKEDNIDPLQKLNDQANEILDILDKLGQAPVQEKTKPIVDQVTTPDPQASTESAITTTTEESNPVNEPKQEVTKPKKKHGWVVAIVVICVVLMALAVCAYLFKEDVYKCIDDIRAKIEMRSTSPRDAVLEQRRRVYPYPTQVISETPQRSSAIRTLDEDEFTEYKRRLEQALDETYAEPIRISASEAAALIASYQERLKELENPFAKKEEEGLVEEQAVVAIPAVPVPTVTLPNRNYTEFITTEKMAAGSSLTRIAKRYYGNRDMWVFIYDANKGHLKDPENVPIGATIRVPKLSQETINMDSPEIKDMVREMSREFQK